MLSYATYQEIFIRKIAWQDNQLMLKINDFWCICLFFFFFGGGGGGGGEEGGGAGGEGNQSVNAQKYRNTLKHSAFVYSFRLLQ